MRVGHAIALLGALLAIIGGTVMDWQHFELADVTARGFEVALAGQAVLLLAAFTLLTSALGLATRRRYGFAGASLVSALFAFGWLVAGNVGKLDAFAIVPFESVEMLGGYTLAVWGAMFMFVGPLVVLASEPAWKPGSRLLRVALLWKDSVVEEKVLRDARTLTIGDALKNDLVIPDNALPARFPLFRADRRGNYSVGLGGEVAGAITLDGERREVRDVVAKTALGDDVAYVPIDAGDWGTLELGTDLRVFFQFVTPEARRRRTGLVRFEETAWSSIAISFFAQVTFVVLGILLWNESFTRSAFIEQKRLPDVEAAVLQMKEPDVPEIEEANADEDESSKAAGRDAGEFGDRDVDPDKRSRVPRNDARLVDRVDAKKTAPTLVDLLATNRLGGEGAISEIMNATSDGMSNKLAIAMAGSDGDFVVGHGSNGMTFHGDGPGGGDDGVGRIMGQGRIDTGGPGIRTSLGPRERRRRVGTLDYSGGQSKGFCKQSQIASVVKRRAGAIRACYEQRLQVDKDLKGKLTVRWTIQLDGSVSGVSSVANTVGDSATTNCVFRALRRMRFTKPDGGICVVQWPFVFSPG